MKGMKKKLAIGVAIVAGLFVVTLLLLEYVVDLNTFSPKIITLAEEALHRKVELGNISLSLLRGPGARVQKIAIFEQDQTNRFVQAKDVVASVKLLPLLSKKVEVAKVVLDEPVVTIKRTASGGWNFDDLLGTPVEASPSVPSEAGTPAPAKTPVAKVPQPQQPSTATPAPAGTPASTAEPVKKPASPMSQFALDTFRLTDGTITFEDGLMNVTTELSQINCDVKGVSLNSPIQFNLSADVDGGAQGKIKASGKVGPIPADGNIEQLELDLLAKLEEIDLAHFGPYYQQQVTIGSEKLNANLKLAGNLGTLVASTADVSVGDVKVDVKGTVEQPQKSPKVDLTVTMPDFPWEKLLQLLPPDIGKQLKDLGLTGIGNLKIQPKGSLDNLVVSGEFDLSKSGIQYQQLFAKPEAVRMALKFETALTMANQKPDRVEIPSLQLSLGDLVLTVAGNVTNLTAASPTLDLNISTNDFALDKLVALFPDIAQAKDPKQLALTSGGTGLLTASAKGAVEDLAVQAVINLDKGKIFYGDLIQKDVGAAGNVNLDAHVGKDDVKINKFFVQLGDFQMTNSGTLKNFANPQLDMKVETNLFDIAKLLDLLPVAKTSLPPELTLGGAGKLTIASAGSLENLTVTGALDMSKGEIVFGKDPQKPDFQKPKDMPGLIEFDATLKQMDAVEIRKVRLNLNDVILDVTGMVTGLKQEARLDLRIKSNKFMLNQLTPLAANMGVNSTGATEFDFKINTSVKQIDLASLVTGTLRLTDVGLSAPQLPKPVKNLNAQINIQGDTVTMQKFSAVVGESSVQADSTIKKVFTAPDITFALYAPRLNVDEFLPAEPQAEPKKMTSSGRRSASEVVDLRPARSSDQQPSAFLLVASQKQSPAPTKPAKSTPPPNPTAAPVNAGKATPIPTPQAPAMAAANDMLQKMAINGTLKIDQGVAKNVHFSALSAQVKMNKGVLTVDKLLFSLYDGQYQGGAKLDLTEPDPKYEFHSELVHVDTNPMLKDAVSKKDVLYGLLFANLAIGGQGATPEKILPSLTGNGNFKVEQGKLPTIDLWSEVAFVFQTIGTLAKMNEFTNIGNDLAKFPAQTNFSRLAGSFELKNGNAGSSDLVLEVPEQDMHIALMLEGKFGFDTSLDFIGKVRFDSKSKYYKDVERQFKDFKQADGSIILPFPIPIGGTLLKPEFNRQSVQKSLAGVAAEMAKQAIKSQVEQRVKEEVGAKALELLTGKKSTPPPTPAVQQTPPTPVQPMPQADQTPSAQPELTPTPNPTPTPKPTPKPEKVLEDVGKDLLKDLFKKKK